MYDIVSRDGFFVLIAALRYAAIRHTFAPAIVCEEITKKIRYMHDNQLEMLIREIENSLKEINFCLTLNKSDYSINIKALEDLLKTAKAQYEKNIIKTNTKEINKIFEKIGYHEKKIAWHKRAINYLRKEKSLLMAKGWNNDKHE